MSLSFLSALIKLASQSPIPENLSILVKGNLIQELANIGRAGEGKGEGQGP